MMGPKLLAIGPIALYHVRAGSLPPYKSSLVNSFRLCTGTDTELLSCIVIHVLVLSPRRTRYMPLKSAEVARESTIADNASSGIEPTRVANVRSERTAISSVNACAVKISLC